MMGFQPLTCDRPRREAPRRFSASELYCSLAGTLAGRYPVRTTGVPVRFNSAWTRMLRAARTAVRGASSASRCPGPAYGVRKTAGLARTPERRRRSGDVNESEALVRTSESRSDSEDVNESLCDSFAHQKSKISGDVNESKALVRTSESRSDSEDVDETRSVSFASRRNGVPADSSEIKDFRDTRNLRFLGTNPPWRPVWPPRSAIILTPP